MIIVMLAFGVVGCGSADEENLEDSVEASDSNVKNTKSSEKNKIPVRSSILARNAYSMYSGGKNYIVVELDFGNKQDTSKTFYDEFSIRAYQNGVEIYQNNSWQCNQFDLKACSAHVQPGYDAKIYMAFEAKDLTSAVNVECIPVNGGTTEKASLNINSQYYVSQQEIDNKKAEEKKNTERAAAEEAEKVVRENTTKAGINNLKLLISQVGVPYCVYDFDKDGNSDVVFSSSGYGYTIYIYEGGSFINMGALGSDGGIFKSKKNGCYITDFNGGYARYRKYEYHNGAVNENTNDYVYSNADGQYIVDGKSVSQKVHDNNLNIILGNEMIFSSPTDMSQANNAVFSG